MQEPSRRTQPARGSQEEKLRAENSTCVGPGGGPLWESYRVHAGQAREEKESRVHVTRDFTDGLGFILKTRMHSKRF